MNEFNAQSQRQEDASEWMSDWVTEEQNKIKQTLLSKETLSPRNDASLICWRHCDAVFWFIY